MRKISVVFLTLLSLLFSTFASSEGGNVAVAATTGTLNFNDPAFQSIWQRNDLPVIQSAATVGRSWTWGPTTISNSPASESYNGSTRLVQYFDKGRMEVNDPNADRTNLFFVTSGLLVKELVSGQRQDGDKSFVPFANGSATIPIAGDPADSTNPAANNNAPTYASFKDIPAVSAAADGSVVNASLNLTGTVGTITPPASVKLVASAYDKATQHNVADVFNTFQNQNGQVFANGQNSTGSVYYGNALFVFGHPISEPYWITTNVGGKATQVLVQLFERRVLTYTPSNPPAFQVEMGNVGQHYYNWRYIVKSPIVAVSGYSVSLFAAGTADYSHPDSIVANAGHVYIDYQNVTAKDGSDNKTSTVVDYSDNGKILATYAVPGHSDGMRFNPYTNLLWVISNEDANPGLLTLNPQTGEIKPYTLPATPHGGGYDDVQFMNGMAFISASNPNVDSAGVNVFPAVDKIELQGTNAVLTPILMGNDTAMDTIAKAPVTLNLIDPDSMLISPQGDLVLDNQAGSQLVFLHNPGTSTQVVSATTIGTQADDSAWATSTTGRMFLVDGSRNATYIIRTNWVAGAAYSSIPNDSLVAGFVGSLDLATGIITPIIMGFKNPHGMIFVPDAS